MATIEEIKVVAEADLGKGLKIEDSKVVPDVDGTTIKVNDQGQLEAIAQEGSSVDGNTFATGMSIVPNTTDLLLHHNDGTEVTADISEGVQNAVKQMRKVRLKTLGGVDLGYTLVGPTETE